MLNFHAVLLLLSTANHLNVFSLRTKKNPIEIVPHLKWMGVLWGSKSCLKIEMVFSVIK